MNITNFNHYNIQADISEVDEENDVNLIVRGLNGEGGYCWDYYIDGVCGSEDIELVMNYNSDINLWVSRNIYPDYIYPETYFTTSEITWNYPRSQTSIWRGNYHIFKFKNSFEMDANMSFWIEFDANAFNLRNSGPLEVYLVGVEEELSYFESDWRNKSKTQLVGTLTRNEPKHHTHSENSSHHLIPLSTNNWGNIGDKNISLNDGNFFIVLYQDSTNVNKGWNLFYRTSDLCDNSDNWFTANRPSVNTWNTPVHQNGCPDSHIHIARRENYVDGANFNVQVYENDSLIVQENESFYFIELPNLPPNTTAFTQPLVNGIYDGLIGEDANLININWNPATDPNNDPLTYDINYVNSNGESFSITTNLTTTDYNWDISSIDDGNYSLIGNSCDTEDACTLFYLDGNFLIKRSEDIYSLIEIKIFSNNDYNNYAITGNEVTLSFTSTGPLSELSVEINSGGENITNTVSDTNTGNDYNYFFIVNQNDADGRISFDITASNLDKDYTLTTNDFFVTIDNTPPVTTPDYNSIEWINQIVTITLSAIDEWVQVHYIQNKGLGMENDLSVFDGAKSKDFASQKLSVFDGNRIRKTWNKEEWWFSIIDIVGALTGSTTPKRYWSDLKIKLEQEGNQPYDFIVQLKLIAEDGKLRETDCTNTEGAFRIIQSIPSPKAEPFKLWLAKVGYDRVKEIQDPELAQKRMRELYKAKGYSDAWIEKRVRGIAIRDELTEEWKNRNVGAEKEYSILTAEISKATFDMTPSKYKEFKGLKRENLRDHMNDLELIFTMLGEKVSTEITKKEDSQGFIQAESAAKKGGKIAGNARKETEKELGKPVTTKENYLQEPEKDKRKKLLQKKRG